MTEEIKLKIETEKKRTWLIKERVSEIVFKIVNRTEFVGIGFLFGIMLGVIIGRSGFL